MDSLAGQVEQLVREPGLAVGCSARTGSCPCTVGLGPGGGISAPIQLWEGAHSQKGEEEIAGWLCQGGASAFWAVAQSSGA